MILKKRIMISIVVIILVIVGAYTTEYIIKVHGNNSAKFVHVLKNNKETAVLSEGVFRELKKSESSIAKKETMQSKVGPSLLYVIASAGINNFREIEIKGLKNNKSFIINRDQVNHDIVFFFTGHGTVNLGNKKEMKNFLVEEVKEINAKN